MSGLFLLSMIMFGSDGCILFISKGKIGGITLQRLVQAGTGSVFFRLKNSSKAFSLKLSFVVCKIILFS